MGGHFPPVTVREVEHVLTYLRFEKRPQKGTSHVHWVKGSGSDFKKVTVDANNAPFKDKALAWMLRQMGISKADFHRILANR